MELTDIITLVKAVSESKLTSFCYEGADGKLTLEANRGQCVVTEMPVMAEAAKPAAAEPEAVAGEYIVSPMVGTFYAASQEGAEPFVSVGDRVHKGQVIGIVEAMKLMNEIESPYDGVVEEILVENKAMVGFGQELIRVSVH